MRKPDIPKGGKGKGSLKFTSSEIGQGYHSKNAEKEPSSTKGMIMRRKM